MGLDGGNVYVVNEMNYKFAGQWQYQSILQNPMSQYQEWKSLSPLLYSYLSTIQLKQFKTLSAARFSKCEVKSSSFKYSEHRTIICGKNQANNGLLTINQLLLPLPKDLDDTRLQNKLNTIASHQFESEVTHLQECLVSGLSEQTNSSNNSFLALSQKNYPEILVYAMDLLEAAKDKSNIINPRIRLKGHQVQITTLKNRKTDIISGDSKGELLIHSLSGHSQAEITYRYHRQTVTDCCWLSHDEREDKLFASCSTEGIVYMWDKRSSLPSSKILPKQGELYCLELLKDNCFLTGGKDGTVKFWDIRNTANRFYSYNEHTGPVKTIRKIDARQGHGESQSGYSFASGAENGEILLWQYEAQFCHLHHQHQIEDMSYQKTIDMMMSIDSHYPSICLWKPALRGESD